MDNNDLKERDFEATAMEGMKIRYQNWLLTMTR